MGTVLTLPRPKLLELTTLQRLFFFFFFFLFLTLINRLPEILEICRTHTSTTYKSGGLFIDKWQVGVLWGWGERV
ncbi:hypothetical protein CROQUDRAFT_457248 [Cronartium quercuum f. sp. fusiforme G11]|uniref:Uncharacterized protein n=1 Tax=Cronartium quercuum f. sp. fusiforme G11 TaxID=708437 RepID=A0A9P6T5L0_9BASI|nr:hypothetical protein CROQUDRAFT_457248 [Cronartium quercuum f. sp. fusiforme G11]